MATAAASHDQLVKAARTLANAADARAIASAFVVSLGEKPDFWRAPLMALASVASMPAHKYAPWDKTGTGPCRECGFDPAMEEFEEDEDGDELPSSLLPGDLAIAVRVLTEAKRQNKAAPKPGAADKARLQRMLAMIGALPTTAGEGKLNDAWRKAKLVLGNKYDCRHVIETLGACSVLETAEHPGFTTKWTTFASRQDRPARTECDPPIAFWTAGHGVAAAGLKRWFGHLGVAAPAVSKARAAQQAKTTSDAAERKAKSDKRAARKTELERGDAVAFAVGKKWIVGIVVDHFRDRGGQRPIIELVEWVGNVLPTLDEVRAARAAGQEVGGKQIQSRLIMADLWKRRDPRRRWEVIGGGLGPPSTKHLGGALGLGSIQRIAYIERIARDAGLIG